MRRILIAVPVVVALLGLTVLGVLNLVVAPRVDRDYNAVLQPPPYRVDDRALAVHQRAFVVDLHDDALLWGRPLLERNERGQTDIPRLVEGGMDLQVFGAVTQSPKGQNYEANTDETDRLVPLFFGTLRPPSTWWGIQPRALVQARELEAYAERSDGRLVLIRSRDDLDAYVTSGDHRDRVAGLLALEGMHPLRGEFEALHTLYDAGYRMMGPAHFFDTAVAGSAHGVERHGLTELGRRLVPEMERLGITVDLAHASPEAVDDILDLAEQPVVVSHTGVQGTCPGPRNLSDDQLLRIAANGGVVGIGFWDAAICEVTPEGIAHAIDHVVEVAGIDHVGLGSDFDGSVTTPFDATGLALITEELLERGYTEGEVGQILGGNAVRVLRANLPEERSPPTGG